MKRLLLTTFAASALLAGAALATPPQIGATLGASLTDIETALTVEGYTVTKIETDDGRTEVYAHDDAQRIELYLDPVTGAVTSMSTYARAGSSAQAGIDTATVLENLRSQGWEVVSYDREQRAFEVYARHEGQLYELRIDPATGMIISQERDD